MRLPSLITQNVSKTSFIEKKKTILLILVRKSSNVIRNVNVSTSMIGNYSILSLL